MTSLPPEAKREIVLKIEDLRENLEQMRLSAVGLAKAYSEEKDDLTLSGEFIGIPPHYGLKTK